MQCKVCMQTFICTTSEVKCREHAEAKHPKHDVYACFPHLKKWPLFLIIVSCMYANLRWKLLSSKEKRVDVFFSCFDIGERRMGSCCSIINDIKEKMRSWWFSMLCVWCIKWWCFIRCTVFVVLMDKKKWRCFKFH